MKIRPEKQSGSVVIRLSAKEATRLASKLVKVAIASGHVEEIHGGEVDRQEPPEEMVEEQAQA